MAPISRSKNGMVSQIRRVLFPNDLTRDTLNDNNNNSNNNNENEVPVNNFAPVVGGSLANLSNIKRNGEGRKNNKHQLCQGQCHSDNSLKAISNLSSGDVKKSNRNLNRSHRRKGADVNSFGYLSNLPLLSSNNHINNNRKRNTGMGVLGSIGSNQTLSLNKRSREINNTTRGTTSSRRVTRNVKFKAAKTKKIKRDTRGYNRGKGRSNNSNPGVLGSLLSNNEPIKLNSFIQKQVRYGSNSTEATETSLARNLMHTIDGPSNNDKDPQKANRKTCQRSVRFFFDNLSAKDDKQTVVVSSVAQLPSRRRGKRDRKFVRDTSESTSQRQQSSRDLRMTGSLCNLGNQGMNKSIESMIPSPNQVPKKRQNRNITPSQTSKKLDKDELVDIILGDMSVDIAEPIPNNIATNPNNDTAHFVDDPSNAQNVSLLEKLVSASKEKPPKSPKGYPIENISQINLNPHLEVMGDSSCNNSELTLNMPSGEHIDTQRMPDEITIIIHPNSPLPINNTKESSGITTSPVGNRKEKVDKMNPDISHNDVEATPKTSICEFVSINNLNEEYMDEQQCKSPAGFDGEEKILTDTLSSISNDCTRSSLHKGKNKKSLESTNPTRNISIGSRELINRFDEVSKLDVLPCDETDSSLINKDVKVARNSAAGVSEGKTISLGEKSIDNNCEVSSVRSSHNIFCEASLPTEAGAKIPCNKLKKVIAACTKGNGQAPGTVNSACISNRAKFDHVPIWHNGMEQKISSDFQMDIDTPSFSTPDEKKAEVQIDSNKDIKTEDINGYASHSKHRPGDRVVILSPDNEMPIHKNITNTPASVPSQVCLDNASGIQGASGRKRGGANQSVPLTEKDRTFQSIYNASSTRRSSRQRITTNRLTVSWSCKKKSEGIVSQPSNSSLKQQVCEEPVNPKQSKVPATSRNSPKSINDADQCSIQMDRTVEEKEESDELLSDDASIGDDDFFEEYQQQLKSQPRTSTSKVARNNQNKNRRGKDKEVPIKSNTTKVVRSSTLEKYADAGGCLNVTNNGKSNWTKKQIAELKESHSQVNPLSSTFWDDVASKVNEKSAGDCREQWFSLVRTPNVRRRKGPRQGNRGNNKGQSMALLDVEEDDIFNSTPLRKTNQNQEVGSFIQDQTFDFGSPIAPDSDDVSPIVDNEIEGLTPFSEIRPKVGNKKYLQEMRQGMARAKKAASRRNAKKEPKSVHTLVSSLSETVANGGIEMNAKLTPGGTLRVKHLLEVDSDEEEFLDESDEDGDAFQ